MFTWPNEKSSGCDGFPPTERKRGHSLTTFRTCRSSSSMSREIRSSYILLLTRMGKRGYRILQPNLPHRVSGSANPAATLSYRPDNRDDADVVLLAKVLGCGGDCRGSSRIADQVENALE